MTYISIPPGLKPLVDGRRLYCLPSLWTGFDTMREIYASRDVMMAVADPLARDGETADHHSEFRATLDAFLEGGAFSVAEDPYNKPSDAMLARVDPTEAEIWDIRSIVPHPGIRCLGGFFARDIFVALTWNYREAIIDWDDEIEKCRREWEKLFGPPGPPKGRCLDDYLSNFIAV